MSETYPKPEHGWTCFHCGETFTTVGAARVHFGEPNAKPACQIKAGAERGLVMVLREAEAAAARAWSAVHAESTDAVKAYHQAVARHAVQLREAEESGYERGLADGRDLSQVGENRMT